MTRAIPSKNTRCRFGVAVRDVTGPVGIYMRWWGAAKHDVAERIHRPATATAAVIAPIDGAGPELTLVALDYCSFQNPEDERVLRSLLGSFSLSGDIARQDAGTLSGGEKTKLALAQLVAGRHNLLLLDEPTNNLDPPSRTGVARALSEWPGTMVIVSHDPEFVEALRPQQVLFMPEGRVDYWEADLLDVVSLA